MNLTSATLVYAGGTGSGCNPTAGKCGRRSTRAELARRSHVPLTAAKLLVAKANERAVAAAVGGYSTKNNSPFDVLIGTPAKIGIEVKTLFDTAKKSKITMHPDARKRKFDFAHKNRLKKVFTVAIDERDGKVYYATDLRSYRLRNMIEVGSIKNLGSVIK